MVISVLPVLRGKPCAHLCAHGSFALRKMSRAWLLLAGLAASILPRLVVTDDEWVIAVLGRACSRLVVRAMVRVLASLRALAIVVLNIDHEAVVGVIVVRVRVIVVQVCLALLVLAVSRAPRSYG